MTYLSVVLSDAMDGQRHLSVHQKMELKNETQSLRKAQEILAVLRVLRVVPSCGQAHLLRRPALHLIGIILATVVNSAALAQPEVIRCLPPEVPITNLPEAVLSEYRAEIVAEFEAYFAAFSTHIACLDAERNRALSEAHKATDAYATFLNIPPTQKGLP